MRMTKRFLIVFVAVLVFSGCEGQKDGATTKEKPGRSLITIGAGSVTGVYFPTAGAIARIVSKNKEKTGVRATVESTGGSEYNTNAMSRGELDMGLVQSDVGYMAYKGEGKFDGRPFTKLRSVFSLHPEPFHIVARQSAKINNFDDLKGKKVNIGNPGSGQRLTAKTLFSVTSLKLSDMVTEELKAAEAPDFLRDGRIDAYFYTVGTGSANITDIANSVAINLIGLENDTIEKLKKDRPYYVTAMIPGGVYPGVEKEVTTFAVKATLLTTEDLPEKVVYTIVKSVFENFEEFAATHPALKNLTPEKMLEGLSAPFHDGAAKYYKERGWIK